MYHTHRSNFRTRCKFAVIGISLSGKISKRLKFRSPRRLCRRCVEDGVEKGGGGGTRRAALERVCILSTRLTPPWLCTSIPLFYEYTF